MFLSIHKYLQTAHDITGMITTKQGGDLRKKTGEKNC
jgi:hypothetical protein